MRYRTKSAAHLGIHDEYASSKSTSNSTADWYKTKVLLAILGFDQFI
jgi:hypothetical protein